ncbi:MAG TPA: hypothetical protein PL169_19060, partial [Leptospiraceae bacterium]|nr:hypothetical protein [Leptospiraceae bacterium]
KRKKHFREVPKETVNRYYSSSNDKYEEFHYSWNDTEKRLVMMESFTGRNKAYIIKLSFYNNGMPEYVAFLKRLEQGFDPHKGIPDGEDWVRSGKSADYYPSGNLKSETCYVAIERANTTKCGEEIHYKEDGSIEKKINHPQKCTQGCDLMIPYREEGKYIAMKDDIKVWDTSIMDKQYKYLKERTGEPKKVLKKGDVVTVVEDLQLTESGNTAPWVKVKLGLFSYGYVSSDHLDGPFE